MKKELNEAVEVVPMLSKSIDAISAVYNDAEASIADMVKALENDATIVANILKLANSPLYGFSRDIKDINQAVSLFGKANIRSFALSLAAIECVPIRLDSYGISVDEYIKKTNVQNALATLWLGKLDRRTLDNLSPAAFLVEIGKIIISQYIQDVGVADDFAAALKKSGDLDAVELAFCGSRANDVSATLFHKWNFDADIVHITRYASSPEDALDDETMKQARYLHVIREAVDRKGNMTDTSIETARHLLVKYEIDTRLFNDAIETLKESI